MSTKMSSDLVLNKPATRVHHAPGGTSTFSFGPEAAPVAAAPEAVPPPPPSAEASVGQSLASLSVASLPSSSVTLVVFSPKGESLLVDAAVLALAQEGIHGPRVLRVEQASELVYVCQKLEGVVIAAALLPRDFTSSSKSSLEVTLMQAGVASGGRVYIVPAIFEANSFLEAKVALSEKATSWAKSCSTLLHLRNDHLPPPVSYETPVVLPPSPPFTADVTDIEDLLGNFRASLAEHGARGIFGLGRKFRIADDDGSGHLELSEFTKMVAEHAMHWTVGQIKVVFDFFDADRSGSLSYTEFLKGVRGVLNDRRKQLVLMAFQILDADKSGVIETSDIQARYDASKHPDVLSGRKTNAEVLREFLDTFDSPSQPDGKVTVAEFIDYYATLSASIDEDDYFELMIRNAWHISGGDGWCANSTCRRVLVTHADGHQTVEEIKDDLGIGSENTEAIKANLVAQGIIDIVAIETKGGSVSAVEPATGAPPPCAKPQPTPPVAAASRDAAAGGSAGPSADYGAAHSRNKRVGAGASSITFG